MLHVKFSRFKLFVCGAAFFLSVCAYTVLADPITVEVRQSAGGWSLLRNGEPYRVRGAGGRHNLELLAQSGGNSIRTWGVGAETDDLLDRAHALGITVSVGIWLGHERHGFNYRDPDMVARQKEEARRAVLAYRSHPAVLVWGIGNEMEGFESGGNPDIWNAVCDIAQMVQELDPHHPVMTTTADIGGQRVARVEQCSSIDIHGINSYGGAPSISSRYEAAGGTKPLMLTEYGPRGTWETAFTSFGAPPEETSTAKAQTYATIWNTTIADSPRILGGYAFLWGWKTEATATWFGLFLSDGTRLGGVDALAEAWGRPPANRAPSVTPLVSDQGNQLTSGQRVQVSWSVRDPEGDPLTTTWSFRREITEYFTGGDPQTLSPELDNVITSRGLETVTLTMPTSHGVYRLYATTRDNKGGGATASLPLLVDRPRHADDPLPTPWWLYRNADTAGPWVPSGWMGDIESIALDLEWKSGCPTPPTCIQVTLNSYKWGGVAWQFPSNDWGKKEESLDLSDASQLSFRVRTEFDGGKSVKFGVGLLGNDVPYPDSLKVEREITLNERWQKVTIPLRGDRSSIKTGFWWVADGGPIEFYLDDIVFE